MNKKRIAIGFLIIVFLISTVCLSKNLINYALSQNKFESLRNKSESDLYAKHNQENTILAKMLPEYAGLYERNSDFIGWIEIEGTILNYPVMYTPEDVEYYLRRDFDGRDSIVGTPFIGYDCTLNPRSDNLIIYGHNVDNGKMFSTLLSYEDPAFWLEHSQIQFNTLYEKGSYEIMSVFFITAEVGNGHFEFYEFTTAKDESDFNAYVNKAKELSLYDTGVIAEFGDDLITLSTCSSYQTTSERFVVIARKTNK